MLKTWNEYVKILKLVRKSSEIDKLFPGSSKKRVIAYTKKVQEYIQDLDIVSNSGSNLRRDWDEIDISLEEVLPKPINRLFKKSSFKRVRSLFRDMESYCKNEEEMSVETSFLGIIIAFYIITMKNLYFIGTTPYFYEDIQILDLENYDYSDIGVSKGEYKKLIPVLQYINMRVDELLDGDIKESDINYFHIILKRLLESEVDM